MNTKATPTVVILGCGHLAWHLASYLVTRGIRPRVINHRANRNLKRFQKELGLSTASDLSKIPEAADYYLLCVSDRYVKPLSKRLAPLPAQALVLHCSGTLPLEEVQVRPEQRAVFYPLQSFTMGDKLDWKEIPLLLEASDPQALKNLNKLAKRFPGKRLYPAASERLRLHFCAVLVSNFTNLLYTEASEFLKKAGQGPMFQHLFPLIRKTAKKAEELSPKAAQTGPAKRGDKPVMKLHKSLISGDKQLLRLYTLLSKRIAFHQNPKHA